MAAEEEEEEDSRRNEEKGGAQKRRERRGGREKDNACYICPQILTLGAFLSDAEARYVIQHSRTCIQQKKTHQEEKTLLKRP